MSVSKQRIRYAAKLTKTELKRLTKECFKRELQSHCQLLVLTRGKEMFERLSDLDAVLEAAAAGSDLKIKMLDSDDMTRLRGPLEHQAHLGNQEAIGHYLLKYLKMHGVRDAYVPKIQLT